MAENFYSKETNPETVKKEYCELDPVLRKPEKIWRYAPLYFKKRLNTKMLSRKQRQCIDHGFAGGVNLYRHMYKIQHRYAGDNSSCKCHGHLLYSRNVFKWFNTVSAWTIACHNIHNAKANTDEAELYNMLKLDDLIYSKNHSLIHIEESPLVFLLDFVDTLDPFKRFEKDGIDNIEIDFPANNQLRLSVLGCERCFCPFAKETLKKIDSDLDFLKSKSFHVRISKGCNSITFVFGPTTSQRTELKSDSVACD